MRIGILEAGHPPERLGGRFPSYGAMVEALVGDGHVCERFDVTAGRWPEAPDAFEAYVVTGSPASVYAPIPWVADLLAFLRDLDAGKKLVGLCFGHQALAQAFGGRVERSERGWGLGLHAYEVIERAPFMDGAERIAIPVSHQDQVVAPPPGARVLAGSAFENRPGYRIRDDSPGSCAASAFSESRRPPFGPMLSRPTACWPMPTGPPSPSSATRNSGPTSPGR